MFNINVRDADGNSLLHLAAMFYTNKLIGLFPGVFSNSRILRALLSLPVRFLKWLHDLINGTIFLVRVVFRKVDPDERIEGKKILKLTAELVHSVLFVCLLFDVIHVDDNLEFVHFVKYINCQVLIIYVLLRKVGFDEKNENKRIFKLLLYAGVDVNLKCYRGSTTLHILAKSKKYPEVVQELASDLLDKGADPNATNCNNDTPLHLAAKYQNNEIFRLLMNSGADIHATNYAGRTPLHWLAFMILSPEEEIQLTAELLGRRADVNAKDINDNTPLHFAAQFEKKKTFRVLINAGADVSLVNKKGSTPLHLLAKNKDSFLESVKLATELLDNGSNVNARDKFIWNSPIYYAARSGNIELIRLFLKYGADVQVKNKYDENLLANAIDGGNLEVVRLLIDLGVDVNHIDKTTYRTLLNRACKCCVDERIIKCLLENGADPNALDGSGRPPLVNATTQRYNTNSFITLKTILKYGADVNITTPDGKNILSNPQLRELEWELIMEHVAKLQVLKLPVYQSLIDNISGRHDCNNYFTQCKKELVAAKNTKLRNSWVTFYNLLLDDKYKLIKYAGNEDLIEDFQKSIVTVKFPIFGKTIQKRFIKGLENRVAWDEAAVILSDRLPVFNPTHLIVNDILNCLSVQHLLKLRE